MADTPPAPSKVLLLAAVADEIQATIQQLKLARDDDTYVGRVSERDVIACVTGIGAEHALRRMGDLLDRHAIDRIIHLGFAGGLDPELKPGDLVTPSSVMLDTGEHIDLAVPADATPTRLLTLDRIADSPKVKAELFAKHGAGIVDMESYHTAKLAAERGVPIHLLRAVSDPANMALPAAAIEWVKPDGTPDLSKAMAWVARHPFQAPALMKLQSHAKLAARHLANRVEALLSESA